MRNVLLGVFLCFLSSTTKAQFSESTSHYDSAFSEIATMIDEEQSSFKKAVFLVENAFYQGQFPEDYFNYSVELVANIVRSINTDDLIQYEGQDFDEVRTHAAIYRAMTDSLVFVIGSDTLISPPFVYDFEDVFGKENWSQMFVSKLLDTRKGNCRSLPYLYKILA